MEKQDIINVLEFVKYNQLRSLQWKAAYLRYQINMLEKEKTEATSQIFRLKRMIGESEETLAQKIKEMAQESRSCDNTGDLYPVPYSEPDTNSDSNGLVSSTKE
jgi:prefoldin subunit 5